MATERSGSRVSIQAGFRPRLARRSFRPTICPLGQPNKAIGHESQIEPWLAIASTLLKGAMRPREGTHQFMIPQPPAKSVRPSRAPAKIRASADGGWMSEKYPLHADEEKCFFLTSPFIEPDGHDDANTVRLTPVLEDAARVLGQKSQQCCEFLVRQDNHPTSMSTARLQTVNCSSSSRRSHGNSATPRGTIAESGAL